MAVLVVLAVLGYLQVAHDPCTFADGRHWQCKRPAPPADADGSARALDQYMRAEWGVLQLQRYHDHKSLRLTPAELGEVLPLARQED